MSFLGPTVSHEEAARLKRLYEELGSLQAVADAENVRTRWLGQVLHGLTSVMPQAVVGGLTAGPVGAAGLVGTAQGYSKTQQLEHEGVDPATARKVGAIEGATQALGIVAPVAIPGRLATRIASGASMNTGIGMAQRGATGKVLADNGYKDMAEQYKVMDGAAIFTDLILGGGFGAFAKGHAKTLADALPSEVDAALAANNVRQMEIDAAPGIPADIETRNAHIAATEMATGQLLRGEEVNVSQALPEDVNFLPKDANPEIAAGWHEAFKEEGLAELQAETAKLEWKPTMTVEIAGEKAEALVEFLEVLEDNDDVQRVTANYEMSEETMKRLGG